MYLFFKNSLKPMVIIFLLVLSSSSCMTSRVSYEATVLDLTDPKNPVEIETEVNKSFPIPGTGIAGLMSYGLAHQMVLPYESDVKETKEELERNLRLRLGIKKYKILEEKSENMSYRERPTVFTYKIVKKAKNGESYTDVSEYYSDSDPQYFKYKRYNKTGSTHFLSDKKQVNNGDGESNGAEGNLETNNKNDYVEYVPTINNYKYEAKDLYVNFNTDLFFIIPTSISFGWTTNNSPIETYVSHSGGIGLSSGEVNSIGFRYYLQSVRHKYQYIENIPLYGLYFHTGLFQYSLSREYYSYDTDDFEEESTSGKGLILGLGFQSSNGLGAKMQKTINGPSDDYYMYFPLTFTYTFWL